LTKDGDLHPKTRSPDSGLFLNSNKSQIRNSFLNYPKHTSVRNLTTYDFRFFKKLNTFIFKLFMEVPFTTSDFQLSALEKIIIVQLLKKKKFISSENVLFDKFFFNKISKSKLSKKKEDCLKFIFNKAITYLKSEFKTVDNKKFLKLKKQKLNTEFYEHYFGDIAREQSVPIECFYDYSLYNKTKNSLIPKSISKQYLEKIKLNSKFIQKIKDYLNNYFMKWFCKFNLKKIQRKVYQWEQVLTNFGFNKGLKIIVDRINSRNNKLFWTLNETQIAMKIALNCLSST
jgi:hypothetical protein